MEENKITVKSIDEYIGQFPDDLQKKLMELKKVIQLAVPEATEKISYGMPTFYLYGNLVHFAAHQKHIGFYPGSSGIEAFMDRFEGYKVSKGTVQFPIDNPFPYDLITEIVRYRAIQNVAWAKEKKSKRKK
ncbi:hypothetical protein acsn021_22230 [Anaerocolumna cellulosilytica]|uniref:YdhG-like domain-containing protein n=1 Tax=Anaerocolumna cellulosilytica TaxID=433286 RepID=A0A6S6QVP0_9FIRM|nr:DUF1801 domain-containing protein [Anaerocolumna cellulosilytica]MBB5194133.1 uncharacterized protein YdhG (YjbR/CyaY superfamily) [Anaerocolumna cellulosilytica]BCJ94654.1 hypothetical protein acsn021_22230 [Anaerocolumna cellulosilytica]